jgi:hypothetical protein
MVTDTLEQSLQIGDPVIWANYGRLYMGVVIKVTARRARLKNIITGYEHQPLPSKIVKVEALPKACLFAAIKGE